MPKNTAVGTAEPAFSAQPIHNQTFERWNCKMNNKTALAILNLAHRDFVGTHGILTLTGPRAGELADSISTVLYHAVDGAVPIHTKSIPLDDRALDFGDVRLNQLPNAGPAAAIINSNMPLDLRLICAIQLASYMWLRQRRPMQPAGVYLTPTGILGFAALHSITVSY